MIVIPPPSLPLSISPCSPYCPGTQRVDASPEVLGLKIWASTPGRAHFCNKPHSWRELSAFFSGTDYFPIKKISFSIQDTVKVHACLIVAALTSQSTSAIHSLKHFKNKASSYVHERLYVCVCVHQVLAWCLRRPEQSTESLGTGTASCELCGHWNQPCCNSNKYS